VLNCDGVTVWASENLVQNYCIVAFMRKYWWCTWWRIADMIHWHHYIGWFISVYRCIGQALYKWSSTFFVKSPTYKNVA